MADQPDMNMIIRRMAGREPAEPAGDPTAKKTVDMNAWLRQATGRAPVKQEDEAE